VIVADVNEDCAETDAGRIVDLLARRKAESVAASCGDALVIGCDSLLEIDNDALGKPDSIQTAHRNWQRLRNSRATLVTGHCLIDTRTETSADEVVRTIVTFGSPTEAELATYLDTGESLRCAGGFTLEGIGAAFIARVDGDALNVMGFSPPALRRLLLALGVSLEELWPRGAASLR